MDPVTLGMAKADAARKYITPAQAEGVVETVIESSPVVADGISSVVNRDIIGVGPISDAIKLPTNVRSEWLGYNGTVPDTFNGYEYVVYVRDDNHPVIGQRDQRTGVWVVTDLYLIFGVQIADGHNYYRVIVDGDGFVHVWGNMHALPMKYAVSDLPNSVASFTAKTMIGSEENSVTYPDPFRRDSNGDIYFTYRNGLSGEGTVYLDHYTKATKTWSRVNVLVDGNASADGVYTSQLFVDSHDVMHVAFCFRGTDSPNSNHDVCYIRSRDFGVTWESISGQPVALPLSSATAPVAFPTAATGSGLLNSPVVSIDANQVVHVAFLLYDAKGATNVYHLWNDGQPGTAWAGEFVTNSTYRMDLSASGGVITSRTARPGIVSSGKYTFVLWRSMDNGREGTVRAVDVSVPGEAFEFSVANLDIGYAEQTLVNADARDSGFLKLLLTPQPLGGVAGSPVTNWQSQWGLILKIDITRLRLLGATQSGRPGLKEVGSFVFPSNVVAKTAAFTNVPEIPPIFIDADWTKRFTLVKLAGRFAQSTGTSAWGVRQQNHTGASGSFRGETPGLGSGTGLSGFRVPACLDGALMPSGGWLNVQAKSSDATAGTTESMLRMTMWQIVNSDGNFLV